MNQNDYSLQCLRQWGTGTPLAEALSQALRCVHRIMAITSAFQADDAGSIPAARSNSCSKVLLMQTPPSDEMKQAKKPSKPV
uniref:Uncharacterized protein n=1 Tax=Vibrio tasmaniensis TaxID=212663 RepID=A0A0H3ZN67_9VIBR|nr:hypothetical protein [Vibrio tasmaniensis]